MISLFFQTRPGGSLVGRVGVVVDDDHVDDDEEEDGDRVLVINHREGDHPDRGDTPISPDAADEDSGREDSA